LVNQLDNTLKTGTTTLGIVCTDGVVLAADMRATRGHLISFTDIDKVIQISDTAAVTIAGTVSDAQLFLKYIKAELRINQLKLNRTNNVKEIANYIGNLTYAYLRTRGAVTEFLLGGLNHDGTSELYMISPDGAVFPTPTYKTSGSGGIFADSVLESEYKQGLTLEQGIALATKAMNIAVKKDSASGNGINIWTITKDGVKKVQTLVVNTNLQ